MIVWSFTMLDQILEIKYDLKVVDIIIRYGLLPLHKMTWISYVWQLDRIAKWNFGILDKENVLEIMEVTTKNLKVKSKTFIRTLYGIFKQTQISMHAIQLEEMVKFITLIWLRMNIHWYSMIKIAKLLDWLTMKKIKNYGSHQPKTAL